MGSASQFIVRVLLAQYIFTFKYCQILADSPGVCEVRVRNDAVPVFCPIREYIFVYMYIRKCVWPRCTCVSVWWSTCCDNRHHADLISVITACQPGALGTSVLHTLVCSECVFICISILRQHCAAGCIHPNRLTLHPSS